MRVHTARAAAAARAARDAVAASIARAKLVGSWLRSKISSLTYIALHCQYRVACALGEFAEPVGGAMGGGDACCEGDLELCEDFEARTEDGEVRV